ncbi:MAG: hypothetical protein ACKOQM_03755 [Novosphingobium sp.]
MNRAVCSLFMFALAAACQRSAHDRAITGDPLIDHVVALEDPATSCVTVGGTTHVYKQSSSGPPAMLEAEKIKDGAARIAAAKIAIAGPVGVPAGTQLSEKDEHLAAEQAAKEEAEYRASVRTFGKFGGERCLMQVNAPAFSGNFAFVSFANSGGGIGAYVFQRQNNDWEAVEKVKLGFW